jgi:dTDP-glucose pyrophosphorylase/predicted transcriptional regulator
MQDWITDKQLAYLVVDVRASLLEAIEGIERGGQGIAFVANEDRRILGSLTDGDIRRMLLAGMAVQAHCLEQAMCRTFVSVSAETGRAEVLDLMRARGINQLPVLDGHGRLCGLHTLKQMITPAKRPNMAVILAGGRGTRLYPLTDHTPKPMVTVAGRPILERLVLHLMSCGIHHIYISVNYLAHVIEDHFGDGSRFGCSIHYLREQVPLGTGGPLALLDPRPTLPIIVMNGDLVMQCNIGRMLDVHQARASMVTCGLRPYAINIPFGVATVQDDRIVAVREKPSESFLVNAGVYVLSPEAIDLIPPNVEFPITDLFTQCLERQLPVGAHVLEEEWIDVGRHEELRKAREGA